MELGVVSDNARETAPLEGGWRSSGSFAGRQALAWASLIVVLANAGAIVWLWVHGGNVSGVHSVADLLTSLGRLTGLLGAYLALIQVLLLARLPWLERRVGFDHLTVWHRLNGKVCLYLILAHVVLTTLGYAGTDRIVIPAEISRLLTSYPGMMAATIGTVLMIVVVLTSLVIARRRLPYEAWYLVHLTVYAGIALAWVHQIPTGNELAVDQAASTYWTGLYLVTLALLVGFRVIAPAVAIARYQLRVATVTVEGPGVVSLHISGRRLDRLEARAGQFLLWRFLDRRRWWQAHPFSLSAVPDGHSLRLTVKGVGDFTRQLASIAPGTRVLAEGPFGVFTTAAGRRRRVALIAGGIGITPIRALAEEMAPRLAASEDLVLIYRVMRDDDLIFRAELDALARDHGIVVFYVVGDHTGLEGERLLSPEHLTTLIPDLAAREVYLCGPPAMMQAAERSLRRAGVPPSCIHTERFAL